MGLLPRDLDREPETVEAYFDPTFNLTWKADIFSGQDYGIDGWRLPVPDELGSLFFGTLGNHALCDATGVCGVYDPFNVDLNTGPFIFPAKTFPIETDHQNWDLVFNTSVLYDPNNLEGGHYTFSFETGMVGYNPGDEGTVISWMVHDGDIGAPIPLPSAGGLLVSGLLILVLLFRREKADAP